MKRAVRARWPGFIEAEDIRHVKRQELQLVIRHAVLNGCNVCVFGGGFPCQDVSLLAGAGRAGIEGNRSSLFRELCRLAADSQSLCRMAGLNFSGFAECVLMSAADEAAVTRELCWPLVLTCPSGAALNRCPRSSWVSRLPKSGPGITIKAEGSHHRMTFFGKVEKPSMWVRAQLEFSR